MAFGCHRAMLIMRSGHIGVSILTISDLYKLKHVSIWSGPDGILTHTHTHTHY